VLLGEPAEVTLRVPPPLDTPMAVEERPGGARVATHDGTVVMEAVPTRLEAAIPALVSPVDAEAAAAGYAGFEIHAFPGCFVCGPERAEGDGLRIFPGELPDGCAAAPWVPDASVGSSSGVVDPEVVWGALDCPTGWSTYYAAPDAGLILLGRLAAQIFQAVEVGKPYVCAAWPAGRDGRKHFATGAILSPDGTVHAVARATWIELKE
jgi:hypothetical protein